MSMLGLITGNDPSAFSSAAKWLGKVPPLTLLAFNQSGVAAFESSIPWIANQGKLIRALGTRVLWSVPAPGAGQLEAIVSGTHDARYLACFRAILAAEPDDGSPVLVRLPWEFNASFNAENAARDKGGAWNGPLFAQAWARLATLARQVSPRFQRIWCPNVQRHEIDPEVCFPGAQYVEIVAQDWYLGQWDHPNIFSWYRDQCDRGLGWGLAFARTVGRPYALSEWGMNDDRFVPDLQQAAAWLKSLPDLHHALWWDRTDGGQDCCVSAGSHPMLAAAYRAALAV